MGAYALPGSSAVNIATEQDTTKIVLVFCCRGKGAFRDRQGDGDVS